MHENSHLMSSYKSGIGPNDICFEFNTLTFSLISNIMPPLCIGLSKRNIEYESVFKLALGIDGLN